MDPAASMGAGATQGRVWPHLLPSLPLTYLTYSISDARICPLDSCECTEWPLGHKAEESWPLCPALGDSGRSWGRPRRRMGTGALGAYSARALSASSYPEGDI